MEQHEWQMVFTAVFCLTLLHVVGALSLFVARRHEHPITGHSLPLMFLTAGTACNPLVISAVYARLRVLCWQYVLFGYGPGIACCVTYCVRAWRIFIYYDIQQRKIDGSLPLDPNYSTLAPTGSSESTSKDSHQSFLIDKSGEQNRNVSHRMHSSEYLMRVSKWCTDRNFFLLALFFSIFFTVGMLVPLMVIDRFDEVFSPDTNSICPTSIVHSTRVAMGVLGITFCLVVYTAWKLRNTFDGYLIKWELKYSATWGIVVLLTMAIDGRLGNIQVVQLVKATFINAVVYQAITWKVLASYGLAGGRRVKEQVSKLRERSPSTSVEHTGSSTNTSKKRRLRDVLDDPVGRRLFTEHLKREWSVENILFYWTVQFYREYPFESIFERNMMAVDIFRQYLADNAATEINIPAAIRDPILKQIGAYLDSSHSSPEEAIEIGADIFDDASRNIYNLMKSDSFQRFQLTRVFQQHISQQEEEKKSSIKRRLFSCCRKASSRSRSRSRSRSSLASRSRAKSKSELRLAEINVTYSKATMAKLQIRSGSVSV